MEKVSPMALAYKPNKKKSYCSRKLPLVTLKMARRREEDPCCTTTLPSFCHRWTRVKIKYLIKLKNMELFVGKFI
jgi:hypothetical protein